MPLPTRRPDITHALSEPLYFPGLNAIRTYAALSVMVEHIATNFSHLRTRASTIPPLNWLGMDAQTAVTLFFVLSGFLITTLLLAERTRTRTIHIRHFYIRRILRIWPLYYLVAVVGFWILPLLLGDVYQFAPVPLSTILLTLLLLPNAVGEMGFLGHLWTVGLEEQFYAFMPWVVKHNRLVYIASMIIILKLALEPVVLAFQNTAILSLFHGLRYEGMAIGALGAWLYHQRHAALRYLYHPLAQAGAVAVCIYAALVDVAVSSLNTFILSIGFMVLILNVATNPRSPLCIENRITNYIGVRSYGLYLYHFPILFAVMVLLRQSGISQDATYDLLLYGATLGLTFAIAALSYRYFEQPLLRLKSRFAVVQTCTEAANLTPAPATDMGQVSMLPASQ